jgi:hypothetical protein
VKCPYEISQTLPLHLLAHAKNITELLEINAGWIWFNYKVASLTSTKDATKSSSPLLKPEGYR